MYSCADGEVAMHKIFFQFYINIRQVQGSMLRILVQFLLALPTFSMALPQKNESIAVIIVFFIYVLYYNK